MVIDTKKFTCIEAFCGAGGLGYGLKKAGFELLFAFDMNPMAIQSYKNYVSPNARVADICELTPEALLSELGLKKGEVTLLSGGPPCQGFSRQKHKQMKVDPRNRLVVKYIRMVQGIEPLFFLMENVDMFQKKRGQKYLSLLNTGLQSKYEITVREINCADYGVPQTRKRTIILGRRRDVTVDYTFPPPTNQDNWVSVGQALKGIPTPPDDGTELKNYPNHCRANLTEINIERIKYVPQGSGRNCLPKRLQLPCHKKKTGWPDVYGRMAVNKPAPTITGGFDSFTRGRFAHPTENRAITYHEAAILQTFPTDFRFFGTKGDIRTQIGNAVPPLIGEILGRSILKALGSIE